MYDGFNYSGWQRQTKTPNTVCGRLEAALEIYLRKKAAVTGVSRTDARVSARDFVCNFHFDEEIDLFRLFRGLNGLLPKDIRVKSIAPAPEAFNARFDSKGKTYRYVLDNSPYGDAFLRRRAWRYPEDLDGEKMRRAAKVFLGEHDFRAFAASGDTSKSTKRELTRFDLEKVGFRIDFIVTGNAFLYNMARILVGTLVYVGNGKIDEGALEGILREGDRAKAGVTAPPYGLCLEEVYY
jgi:tRNA pseudouridine38-40 synthase